MKARKGTPSPQTTPPNGSARRPQLSRKDILERLAYVEDLIEKHTRTSEVKRLFGDRYGVGERASEMWIRRVYDRWAAEADVAERATRRAEIEATTKAAFRLAQRMGQPKTMISANELLANLYGLFDPDDTTGGDVTVVFEGPEPDAQAVPGSTDSPSVGNLPGDGTLPRPGGGTPVR